METFIFGLTFVEFLPVYIFGYMFLRYECSLLVEDIKSPTGKYVAHTLLFMFWPLVFVVFVSLLLFIIVKGIFFDKDGL